MYAAIDGTGSAYLGHDPDPVVELVGSGDSVRLVVDIERSDSPVIEVSAVELRRLLDGVGRDLAGFLALAAGRARRNLPDHADEPANARGNEIRPEGIPAE
ncbi:hypothetical protein [Streptomyces rubiginosohelvolus]|uniref:hypothetical protein n=1 Tax=Streptomyces rubiginosohelvolus TaxID=67362 RepID=UPI0036803BF4